MSITEIRTTTLSALDTTADVLAFETPSSPSCTTNCNYLTSTSTSTASHNLINAPNQANHFVLHFSWFDYGFFLGLLGLSTLIGIYYGFFSKHKQNNPNEYILGGRTMKILPVATSLIATHISGQTLVGLPTEIYSNGTQYVVFVIVATQLGLSLTYVFLPLYHNLGVTSSFEYLERRFDRRIRLLASFVYTTKYILFIPLVIYVPALAFSQVSGLNLHYVTPAICAICVFHTTIGGLRAVVWTDFMVMLAAIIIIILLGTNNVGGFANVWSAAERGGRLIMFNMDLSPFVRTSFWTLLFHLNINFASHACVGQTTVQRFLSLPDLKAAKRSVIYFVIGITLLNFGLNAGNSRITYIVPYYIVQIGQEIPGLAGLFVAGIFAAGIFAAALSTMSSAINTLAGTIYTDIFKDCFGAQTEKEASTTMKWISIGLGVLMTLLVFLVEKMGSVFQIGTTIGVIFVGTFFAMFVLGMTSRSANSKGLVVGVVVYFILLLVMMIGAQMNNIAKEPTLPVQIDGCPNNL
ncbi:sodium-coupled monocarboxylate transporter 1-like [Contarinia nasturtii]|uniref:sodium-coupled monocarboxylate transporter 1-like n=1 Tax=Contarinia nasturtii TaxID=265458 RepID=UPI0012D3BAEF|nr:sodium-coupled monocarboxylate transporter 1-like [Contarinia nasturtii]